MNNIPATDLPIPGAGTGACTLIDPADGLVANLPAEWRYFTLQSVAITLKINTFWIAAG